MDSIIKIFTVKSKLHEYPVIIGNNILKLILDDDAFKSSDKCALFVNKTIYNLYKELLESTFCSYKKCEIFIVKDGESVKQFKNSEKYLSKLLKSGYTRNSLIVAIGGGVTGDFAGFVASVYMRGIKLIQVPTTLLSMVDSSIGGKVAVNLSSGKNMIGVFYPPVKVITDLNFLQTLNESELRNGISESLKHAFIGERDLYELLEKGTFEDYKKSEFLKKVVPLAAGFKIDVVSKDESEKGLRAILNYGHTAGHAIESYKNYKGISHGEAVAIGMKIVSEISNKLGFISNDELNSILKLIAKYGLIYSNINFNSDKIIEHMKYDKKNKNDQINFVLLKHLFNPEINCLVDNKVLKEVLENNK
jgi:3-dehydroquinate synthase